MNNNILKYAYYIGLFFRKTVNSMVPYDFETPYHFFTFLPTSVLPVPLFHAKESQAHIPSQITYTLLVPSLLCPNPLH